MTNIAPLVMKHAGHWPIYIDADGDSKGRNAAYELYLDLKKTRVKVANPTMHRSGDPASRYNNHLEN